MANALAASILPHLGQPTTPPTAWAQEGETVIVVLADGRKVSASIQDINALMFPPVVGADGVRPENILTEKQGQLISQHPTKPSTTPARRPVKK